MKPTVLVMNGEPGGSSAVRPVVDALRFDGKVEIGIGDRVDFLLTSTSGCPKSDNKKFIAWANQNKIPSLAVLDFWSNYRLRFADEQDRLVYLPEKIAVMDELAVSEMVLEGFPPERLVVTGQPAFDCLIGKRDGFTERREYWTRKYYGMRDDKKTLVFVSQPLSKQSYSYGYNEHQVIRLLLDAIADCKNIDLIIRPHPREDIGDLMQYASPNVTIQRKGLVHELLMAADLVVGMNSELLVEACYLGCAVLSIQPGIDKANDRLPTNKIGVSVPLYTEDVKDALFTTWFDYPGGFDRLVEREPATPKVCKLIYERLGI